MSDAAQWPSRFPSQAPPQELVDQAARNPGGSVAEIDPAFVVDVQGYVPAEAIRGVWLVDEKGRLTGEFRENPRCGPPQDDFSRLIEPDHWMGWLGDDPVTAVREAVAGILAEQVPGAVLEWMKVVQTPRFLTGGRQSAERQQLIVTRAGIAVPFALSVRPPDAGPDILTGVFSWVSAGLDRPGSRQDQVWLDLWTASDAAEELLRSRIHEVGRPPD